MEDAYAPFLIFLCFVWNEFRRHALELIWGGNITLFIYFGVVGGKWVSAGGKMERTRAFFLIFLSSGYFVWSELTKMNIDLLWI